jgi:hypothetical protein
MPPSVCLLGTDVATAEPEPEHERMRHQQEADREQESNRVGERTSPHLKRGSARKEILIREQVLTRYFGAR